MEAGMKVDPDPADEVVVHATTDWDTHKRADHGPRQPVYSSRKTRRTIDEVSENHQHADDQANWRKRP